MKKYNWRISIIFTIIVVFITIGYSAFNIEMDIGTILSYYRAESDIRITALSIESVEYDGLSLYEEYGKNSINTSISLPNANSTITYAVDVTNIGGTYMVISNIKNLPDNLTYEFENYNLNHLICDNNNECILGITKQLLLTIKYKPDLYNSNNTDYNLNLEVIFEEFTYTIRYESNYGLSSGYQEVEYIESKRNRRLNTLYIPKKNSTFELDLSFSGTFSTNTSGTNAFFNSYTDIYSYSMNFGAATNQGNAVFTWFDVQYKYGGTIHQLQINDSIRTNKNTIKYGNGKISYGTSSISTAVKTTDHTDPVYLFGNSTLDFNRYDMKVYRLKFYEGGTLVSELIPCYRISDGKTGMYDVVRNIFVSDVGGEEFELGPKVNDGILGIVDEFKEQKVRFNEKTNLELNMYKQSGYFFKEWNTDKNNNGTPYQDGAEIINLTEVSGTTITLYAIWEEGFEGMGTSDTPYKINNIEDMVLLSNYVNNKEKTFENEYFLMTRDLDFFDNDSYKDYGNLSYGDINGDSNISDIKTELTTGLGFPLIGTQNEFKGFFDGGNYTLSNLYIYNSDIGANQETLTGALSSGNLALFSNVTNGSISNIKIDGSIYSSKTINIGGIVGNLENGTIDNVENNSTITLGSVSAGAANLGGIASLTAGTCQILNAHNNADIIATDTGSTNRSIIGGITADNTGILIIKNSSNTGNISYGWRSGGIQGAITKGNTTLLIDTCSNSGTITGNITTASGENTHTGGLVGLSWAPTNTSNSVYVINSYNTGKVIANYKRDASGIIGSIASRGTGYVINSYNVGIITGEGAGTYAAGILNYNNTTSKKFISNNAFNYGSVTGKSYSYGIGYMTATPIITNTYYNSINTGSNKSIGTSKTVDEFNTQEFTDTLNSNIESIDLDTEFGIKLATDYNVSLCNWKLGTSGYPELDC